MSDQLLSKEEIHKMTFSIDHYKRNEELGCPKEYLEGKKADVDRLNALSEDGTIHLINSCDTDFLFAVFCELEYITDEILYAFIKNDKEAIEYIGCLTEKIKTLHEVMWKL